MLKFYIRFFYVIKLWLRLRVATNKKTSCTRDSDCFWVAELRVWQVKIGHKLCFFDFKCFFVCVLILKTLQPAIKIVLSHHPIRPNPQFPKTNSTSQNLGIITKISGWSLILKSSFHGDDKNERKKRSINACS